MGVGLKSDGTLSRPRSCKPLYGPSQGDETGDWTDDSIGLLHVIRLRNSIFIGGQTSTLSLKRDDEPHNDGQWNVSHRLSRRLNNATGQCPVVRPSHVDNGGTVARGISTSRCPVVCPVVPSSRRFLDQPAVEAFSGGKEGGLIDFYRGSCAIHYIYVSLLFDREH